MLYDDDDSLSTSTSTSNSSSSDDDDETSSENEDMAPMGIPVSIPTTELLAVEHDEARPLPAKKRIKLSLQLGRIKSAPQPEENGSKEEKHQSEPLPEVDAQPIPSYTEKKSLPPKKMKLKTLNMEAASTEGPSMADDEGEVEAMVVDGDEVGEDDAVAAVVEEAATKEPAPKKRTTPIVRSVRMPPIPSPGLLLLPGSGGNRGTADENGLVTPASLFDNAMSALGYTIEERTTNPHRGSSVKKEVGDMFDSNVKFSLHFPELVPAELLSNGQKEEETDDSQMNGDHKSLPERLIRAFATTSSPSKSELANRTAPPKRRKLTQFSEMVPLSLAMPYPEEYIQKRLEYIEKIKER